MAPFRGVMGPGPGGRAGSPVRPRLWQGATVGPGFREDPVLPLAASRTLVARTRVRKHPGDIGMSSQGRVRVSALVRGAPRYEVGGTGRLLDAAALLVGELGQQQPYRRTPSD